MCDRLFIPNNSKNGDGQQERNRLFLNCNLIIVYEKFHSGHDSTAFNWNSKFNFMKAHQSKSIYTFVTDIYGTNCVLDIGSNLYFGLFIIQSNSVYMYSIRKLQQFMKWIRLI